MQNDTANRKALDLPAFRDRMAGATGKQYWRGLEEIAATEEFREMVDREFPHGSTEWFDPVSRRNFLKLMGASLALAGIGACAKQPDEKIVPYVKAPEQFVPGKPSYFATAMPYRGYAIGLLAESHLGRPTKLEGNPDHPASLGSTDAVTQAAILNLYDPDRSQNITNRARISSWQAFLAMLSGETATWKADNGKGVRVLSETISSPTLADQMRQFQAAYPQSSWHQYEPLNRDNVHEGAVMAFGEAVETVYHFDKADIVLSIDADFMLTMPGAVRYSRDFTSKRKVAAGSRTMNRLYHLETAPTVTGSVADHRVALTPSQVAGAAFAIGAGLGVQGAAEPGTSAPVEALKKTWIPALVRDLQANRGRSVVVAGDEQPAAVHALAHAMNAALGNAGVTVTYHATTAANAVNQTASLDALIKDIDAGTVDVLVVLGGNPVYNAPADMKFAERIRKVRMVIHLGTHDDETAHFSHWHIPETHFLETWSDSRAFDGTVSIIQPLVAPLWGARSAHEVMAALISGSTQTSYDVVRAYWQNGASKATAATPAPAAPAPGVPGATDSAVVLTPVAAGNPAPASSMPAAMPSGDFDKRWHEALYRGVVPGTIAAGKTVALRGEWSATAAASMKGGASANSLELAFRQDPILRDGRFSNNGWLQEIPKPLSKLVWDNALLVSPKTAGELGWETEDVVEVGNKDRKVSLPVWVMPGHADGCATVYLGHGRTLAGRVGNGVGVDVYPIRTSDAQWHVPSVTTTKTGDSYTLVTTQMHHSMEGRDIIRHTTLVDFLKDPRALSEAHEHEHLISLYPERSTRDIYAWGMAIDLTACSSCSACIVACQSENNIPVVGKDQVKRGREMHWIRVDRYYEGSVDNPHQHSQPVTCMQCEVAPCESVCPVGATVHSAEGLNDMVYNRCIGTRYCSNNCPYKVRRFNYLLFSDLETPSYKMMRNPDVTVRSRGVMEKCTYCVQRINHARIESKKEGRELKDGEVITACAQACPTEAITFGNINDATSRVSKLKASALNYALLEDLNTKPRTTYLSKLRNPNPELETEKVADEAAH